MGEAKKGALRVDFDRNLKVEFHGSRVSSDVTLGGDWRSESLLIWELMAR